MSRFDHQLSSQEQAVSITLRPLPDSPWLSDDTAFGTSIVSLEHVLIGYPSPITVLGVTMDGPEVPFRVRDNDVIVSPRVPRQGGYLTIHGKAPKRAVVDRQQPSQGHPSQTDGYGFQRPVNRPSGQRA